MEWSNELVLEFLSLYEAEPIIWNPRDPNHKNRNLIHDAWKRIENEMSIKYSIVELKKKKDTLMGTFRKLLQKVKASTRTGSGTNEVVKPEWFAFNFMYRFLKGIYAPNPTTNSELSRFYFLKVLQEEEERESIDGKEESGTQDIGNEEENVTQDIGHEIPSKTSETKGTKRKFQVETDLDKKMNDAYNVFKNIAQKPPPDQCFLYAELLATKLRDLDPVTREMVMLEIDLLIYRFKYNHNSPHTNLQNLPSNSHQCHYPNNEPNNILSRPGSSASSHFSSQYSGTTNSPLPSPFETVVSNVISQQVILATQEVSQEVTNETSYVNTYEKL